MGKTYRDTQHHGQVIEIIRNEEETFNIFLNQQIQNGKFTEEQLAYELCVRFGYCQDEFLPIQKSLKQTGRAELRP